jgi:hypothetical protein
VAHLRAGYAVRRLPVLSMAPLYLPAWGTISVGSTSQRRVDSRRVYLRRRMTSNPLKNPSRTISCKIPRHLLQPRSGLTIVGRQEKIWEKLSISPDFNSRRVFPSAHQLDYVRKYLDPIASEVALRHYARETVENPARTLIEEIHKHEQLRDQLQLRGAMMFKAIQT